METGPVTVTVYGDRGAPVGRIVVRPGAPPAVEVLDEGGRARVESLAAHLARPRPAPPRPSCPEL